MKFNLTHSRKTLAWVLIALVIFVIITITGIFLIINEGFATTPLIFFILGALGIFVCALALANIKSHIRYALSKALFISIISGEHKQLTISPAVISKFFASGRKISVKRLTNAMFSALIKTRRFCARIKFGATAKLIMRFWRLNCLTDGL